MIHIYAIKDTGMAGWPIATQRLCSYAILLPRDPKLPYRKRHRRCERPAIAKTPRYRCWRHL